MINELARNFKTNEIGKKYYKNMMNKFYVNLGELAELIKESDVKSIHIEDARIIAELTYESFSTLKLYFDVEDTGSPIAETINFGHFEQEYSSKLISSIKQSNVFFDVGANVGYYSLIAGLQNKNCRIFSFEPVTETYEKLLDNVTLNKLQNISAFNFGFLEKDKEISMFYDANESTAASLENIRDLNEIDKTKCKFTTIDSFVKKHKVFPDLIKIDVEGAELFALMGAVDTLKNGNPTIFIEILRKWCAKFGHTAMDVFNFLYDLGYSSYVVRGSSLERIHFIDESTVDTNFIFMK